MLRDFVNLFPTLHRIGDLLAAMAGTVGKVFRASCSKRRGHSEI